MSSIEEKQKQRFLFLKRLYELTDGNERNYANMFEIGKELGFDKELAINIVNYLIGEVLVRHAVSGGIIAITHLGILEIEEALSNPNKPTEHFLPINIISIEKMIGSQIQQASPGATQMLTISEDKYDELREVLQELKESIDKLSLQAQQKTDLQADIDTIEAQLSSSKPNGIIINISYNSIKETLKGIAESAIGSAVYMGISKFLTLGGQ